jgi:large repetitive protein
VDVSVDFMTADGSAIAGTDYMATNGTLVFPAGTTNLQLHVTVNGDPAAQVDRTFSVNLSNPTNAVIEDGEGVATIVNDSAPSLSIDDISFVEGNAGRSNALFTVTLSRPSDRLVTVRYVTVRDTATSRRDFKPRRGTVRIPAGETRATIAVPIVGETLSEEDEQFAVRLSRSVNAVIADDQGICTIVDDDAFPEITISDAAGVEADAGARNFIFAVQLSAKSGRTVTVDFASADGTAAAGVDYTPVSGTLVFPPGTTAQRIVVSVLGNRVSEENKTFFVNLRNPVNATIADGQGLGSVRDNDRDPALSIDDVTIEEGGVGKTIATFQLRLSAPSGKPVSVSFATADGSAVAGSDFLGTNGVVEIPPGTVEVGLPMIVLGNVATGPNRSFTVELSAPVHATLARARGVCTIKDDDVEAPTLAAAALSKSASGQLMQKASADALPITVITPPANQTACVGATIVFSVQAEGDDIQYQWLKGSSTLAGQTSRTLVLPNVTAASAGTYRVRLTGPENTVTVSATLVVQTPVSATPLPNLVRALGSIAVFRTTPSGTGPFTYEWWHGDRLIEGQTSSSLTLSNLALHQSGTYRVVVGGECGTVTQSATLEVAPCFQNVDVMLVIDRSGSMDGQPYREALRASTNFARNLHLSTWSSVEVGL